MGLQHSDSAPVQVGLQACAKGNAGLGSKPCLQGWQILGKGKSEGGLSAGNMGTVRQSAVENQLYG